MIVEDEGFLKHWARRLFGPHHEEPPPPPTRDELVQALAKVDRQLAVLKEGPIYSGGARVRPADFGPEIAELEAVRTGLAQSLADMGCDGEPAP